MKHLICMTSAACLMFATYYFRILGSTLKILQNNAKGYKARYNSSSKNYTVINLHNHTSKYVYSDMVMDMDNRIYPLCNLFLDLMYD